MEFDQLPSDLLYGIFKQISIRELFNLRLLNKGLYNVIQGAIKFKLIYSKYSEDDFEDELVDTSLNFTNFIKYQQEFIFKDGEIIKHLIVDDDTINYINYCPNLTAITYHKRVVGIPISGRIKIQLPKLKKIFIDAIFSNSSSTLNLFEKYLNQIEDLNIKCNAGDIKDIIKCLDPSKIKSLKIFCRTTLNFDELDKIKTEFINLEELCLKAYDSIEVTTMFNPSINFASCLKLEIKAPFGTNFNISYFGDLSKMKKIKYIDCSSSYLEINKKDVMNILKNTNITSLGYLNLFKLVNCDLSNFSALEEVYISQVTKEILKAISLVPTIQKIHVDYLRYAIKGITKELNFNIDKTVNTTNCNEYKCKHVNQIIVEFGYGTRLDDFLLLLEFFPNLKAIKLIDFTLKDAGSEVNYRLTTPLLIIAPDVPTIDNELYDKLVNIPLLTWLSL
ncbi:hypothetical protein K502DRAFT_332811 [Neoconidiobolus thromboides FSU 785]|nr:hypothetical protein K502DRAFT_332811 [Neoconidiobolus thromboides FSU 785]